MVIGGKVYRFKWQCFRLENGCAALKVQSPLTSGAIWYIKGFPYPAGTFTNTSLPLRNSATAFSCCGLRFWTPNVEHTPETALTLVALARDFLLTPSVNARSLAIKLFKLFASGEKINTATNQNHYQILHSPLKLIRNWRFSHLQEQPDIIELVWSSFTVAILVFSMMECEMK